MKRLIVIGGPTASGKTALSVELAKRLNTVVLSADSRQFYKEMSIGTAKPTLEEMDGITHYFIDSHSISEEINSAQFASEATQLTDALFLQYDTIILTGGSGMFIDAFIYGLDDIPHSETIAKQVQTDLDENGLDSLLAELEEKDPEYFAQVDRQNPMRIIRALEVIRHTGNTFTSYRTGKKKENYFTVEYYAIDVTRDILYERINFRVDQMVAKGLEKEARSLLPYQHLKSLQTVGYSEWYRYFNNEIDYETCVSLIKQNSRRYAKRQITWFKRNPAVKWIPFGDTLNHLS